MSCELSALSDRGTWDIVERPSDVKVVDCRWVYKTKWSHDRSEIKLKSRLVARGFTQEYGVNYFETYAPVVKSSSVRLLLAVAVECGLIVEQIDIRNAYVNSDLDELIYMEQPEGFEYKERKKYVLKLKKSLYGLKQSGNKWNKCLNKVLTEKLGFTRLKSESCIYVKGEGKEMIILAVYVDDILIFATYAHLISELKSVINSEFEIDDIGECKKVIGMNVICENNKIQLHQKQMIEKLLMEAKVDEYNKKSPLDSSERLFKCTMKSDECGQVSGSEYRSYIGSLNYIASTTRPDLTFSVSYLSQFNKCPHREHMRALRRVLQYLKGSVEQGIVYEKCDGGSILHAFVDADWAQCPNDRRSYTGYAVKLCGGLISWESKKQETVAHSSTEAEYMALSNAAKEIKFIRNILEELKLQAIYKGEEIELYVDNRGAMSLAENNGYSARTKHIDVRHHYIRELVENKIIKLKEVSSSNNIADIFTKPLGTIQHSKISEDLLVRIVNKQ